MHVAPGRTQCEQKNGGGLRNPGDHMPNARI
jgi:hypothetical protein